MASPTAVMKRFEERLAFLTKLVSVMADEMGIDVEALISEIEVEEVLPDRTTLKSMNPVPETEDVPLIAGSEMEMELPEEVAVPVAEEPIPPKKPSSRSEKKSAAD